VKKEDNSYFLVVVVSWRGERELGFTQIFAEVVYEKRKLVCMLRSGFYVVET
jgi:hypothetical protein